MKNRTKVLAQRTVPSIDTWRQQEAEVGSRILDYLLSRSRGALPATALSTTEEKIFFRTGSATLDYRARATLRDRAAALRDNPRIRVLIGGFTIQSSFTAAAMKLALKRVQTIQAFVLAQGIHPARIDVTIRGAGWCLVERSRGEEENSSGRCLLQITDPQWAPWRN